MKHQMEIIGYPFVNHVPQDKRPIVSSDYILNCFNTKGHSALHNLMTTGVLLSGGYRYDCRGILTKYLVKQHGGWFECYAPTKTALRKNHYGRIEKIIKL